MAEFLGKKYLRNWIVESAGTQPQKVHPIAIKVMSEINIDISNSSSKLITKEKIKTFDVVITLCGGARDSCVNMSSMVKEHIHWDIIDPAKAKGSDREKLDIFRTVRKTIENKIKKLYE